MSTLLQADLNDAVTRHMSQDFPRLSASQTVGAALEQLRRQPPQGRIIYFYVVDEADRLEGVVPTRRLLLSPPETPLANVMVRKVVTLPAAATVLEACEFFIQHRFLALPVVDDERHLLGVVDIELYTDEVSQLTEVEKRDDLFQTIGVRLADAKAAAPLSAFRSRFPWLGCNLAAGILAAFLSGVFHAELESVVALAYFIPVVLNLAESVSSQSVSLALQWLHAEPPTWKAMGPKMRAEATTGLLLGLASGCAVGVVALLWLGHLRVALCLLISITGGVIGAALLGLTMPVVLRLFKLEPRVAAGPIALAGSDVITLLIYFNLARALIGG